MYSCDDMNKIRMGPATAVSRYHQPLKFFMQTDSPNFNDHDFPNPGYLIVCSGYQQLVVREGRRNDIDEEYVDHEKNDLVDETAEGDEVLKEGDEVMEEGDEVIEVGDEVMEEGNEFLVDKLGRKHYRRFMAGPTLLVLRATMFETSSGQTHANDILPMLCAQVSYGKGIAVIKVDNGSDWNLLSFINELYFCRIWKLSGLDGLGIVSYAAKFSAYNNIEHTWSVMSKKLNSVILPSVIEGETQPPCKQSFNA